LDIQRTAQPQPPTTSTSTSTSSSSTSSASTSTANTTARSTETTGNQPGGQGTNVAESQSLGRASGIHLGSVATDREILTRGRRAFERGDDSAALENLTRLVSHGFEYADVYYMIGMLHERGDDLEAAIHSLRRSIRINPSYVEALLALASLHEQRGDFDQSQGYAERASQLSKPSSGGLDPTTRGKLANQQAALGDAFAQAGEQREAIEEYRRALDRCPTFHDVRHRLGMTLREAGLPSQAMQEFQRILRSHSHMLDSQVQLGLTYYSMGRTPEAIAEWEAVLERDPSRDEARMYLRLVRGVTHRATVSGHDKELAATSAADLSTSATGVSTSATGVSNSDERADSQGEEIELDISHWTTSELATGREEPGE
jgi:tetratricopeptide (TPR) repeat protein